MGLDVVVLGAGLLGLSTADALLQRGARVTLIEARPGPVRGTSHSNSGMIHPSQFRPWRPTGTGDVADEIAGRVVRDLAKSSAPMLRARIEELGLTDAMARPIGCYQLYPDVRAARNAQARFAADDIRANVVIDPAATFGLPSLYFPDDTSANARDYGEALAADLSAHGATIIYEGTDVRLRRVDGGVAAALGAHRFRADHLVVACGVQSAAVLAQFELALRVEPVRGWAVDFALPDDTELPRVPVMDAKTRSALTVFGDTFRLSGTWNEDSAKPLLERWVEIIPDAIAQVGKPLSVWSGLRPVSKAGRPFIGPTPVPGLWVNTGHGHLGWTLCTASGELLARMMVEGETDERFAFAG